MGVSKQPCVLFQRARLPVLLLACMSAAALEWSVLQGCLVGGGRRDDELQQGRGESCHSPGAPQIC